MDLRRNADAVVDNFDHHLAVFQARADADFPGAIDRMNRVVDQIGPNLIQFVPISHDARQRPIKFAQNRHILQLVTEHGQGALQALMNFHLLEGSLVHVRIRFDRLNQFGNSPGALLDLADQRFKIQARFQPTQSNSMTGRWKLRR